MHYGRSECAGNPFAGPGLQSYSAPYPVRMPETSQLPTAALVQRAASVCADYKAADVLILNLQGVTEMTDFFVIASGTSDTHVRSLADRVQEDLKKEGVVAHHAEGLAQ